MSNDPNDNRIPVTLIGVPAWVANAWMEAARRQELVLDKELLVKVRKHKG